jgi:transporter family protein
MSSLDLSILFALLAGFCWGLSDFFEAKAAKKLGPVLSMLVLAWLELPLFIIVYLISGQNWHFSEVATIYAAAAGVVFCLAGTLFLKGLDKGPVSLVSPIASTYPLITTLIVILAFGAKLSLIEVLGIILIMIGVTAASGLLDANKKERRLTLGVKFAVLTSLIWGLGFALLDQAIKRSNWQKSGLIEILALAIATSVIVPLLKGDEIISIKAARRTMTDANIWLGTFIGLGGVIFIYVALSKSTSNGGAVPTAVSSIYPVMTMALAVRHFKEKTSKLALGGALVGIVGVLVLSI